jgi:alkylation response protein AidB-like acyl-CoA dehydrogenase
MNLLANEDQRSMADMFRQLLNDELPVRRYQNGDSLGGRVPAAIWSQLANLGWFGLTAPEQLGGTALGSPEEILLAKEAGRFLLPFSVVATELAVLICHQSNEDVLAEKFVTGKARCTFGLDGDTRRIFDGVDVTYVLFLGKNQITLEEIISPEQLQNDVCIDEATLMQSLPLLASEVILKAKEPDDRMRLSLILSAYLAGIADATLSSAVAYASEREQFGQVIGSFQAINHLCADMAVVNEAAWAQVIYASLSIQEFGVLALQEVAAAVRVAVDAAFKNSRSNIQVHGGVGFTVEYDAHLYIKRSHVVEQLLRASLDSTTAIFSVTA